jgi:hypothetical protein
MLGSLTDGCIFRGPEENVRRLVGIIATAALAAALSFGMAAAALTPGGSTAFDLSPKLMMQLFGESSDSRASLAGAYGDRTSESPLRDFALGVRAASDPVSFVRPAAAPTFALTHGARSAVASDGDFNLAQTIRVRLLQTNLRFSSLPPAEGPPSAALDAARTSPPVTFTAGEYQPVAPVTEVSPQSVAFSFTPTRRASSGSPQSLTLAFDNAATPAGATGSSTLVPAPVHLGPLQFTTRLESASLAAPALSMNDNAYGAGANFDVRAGARNLNVDLSSNYERLTRNDTSGLSSPAIGATTWELPSADVPLVVPNYADMSKVTVGAALAVPVVNGVTLKLNYAADRLFGGYGMPGVTNLDATDNSYGGKLTFDIPHSSSTLSISARQLRYQDNLIPANTSTTTREDVNLTVKF